MEAYFRNLYDDFQIVIPILQEWWYLIVPAFLTILSIDLWKRYSKEKWWNEMEFVYLAINVPTDLEKSPKVMEQFFQSVFGMQALGSWSDRFWKGRQQLYLSLELVGIGGVLRFVIMCPKQVRDFIEAQLYAEYPEAEIVEVEDYTKATPFEQVKDDYDMFLSELKLIKDDPYPIRTYLDFEHGLTQQMLDPIANVAETFTNLQPGEQAWIQILAAPSDGKWAVEGLKTVDELMHRPKEEPATFEIPLLGKLLEELTDIFRRSGTAPFKIPEEAQAPLSSPELREFFITSPGERSTLEALERNMTKGGYNCKVRFAYMAPKEISRMDSVVNALFGIFWQYQAGGSNGFAPHKKHWTKIDYFLPKYRVNRRKRKIFERYVRRDWIRGVPSYVLTTEELATVFHFPSITVQAPHMERIESKKGEPPANLPVV